MKGLYSIWVLGAVGVCTMIWVARAPAQNAPQTSRSTPPTTTTDQQPVEKTTQDVAGEQSAATEVPSEAVPPGRRTPAAVYGAFTLIPPLVAIILAIVSRQVVPSLLAAIFVGAYMMQLVPTEAITERFGDTPAVFRGFRLAVEYYIIGAFTSDHLSIIIFTLFIGAMVGVMAASGGTGAMVDKVSAWASNPKRGQIMGWLAGLVVFFDDYANSMIVGPTMRPIYDKLRISRQKLAYVVDSTAAPVSSIALIGTWVGAEVGYIEGGLKQIGGGAPDFILSISAYEAFLYSIPYRFYAIFALVMVFLIGATNRDFGPMKKAERRAMLEGSGPPEARGEDKGAVAGKWWYAAYPIIMLVVLTLVLLIITGGDTAGANGWLESASAVLRDADPYVSIMYGASGSLLLAAGIALFTRTLSIQKTVEGAMEGMTRMFPALIVLILAWSLSDVLDKDNLMLANVASSLLGSEGLQMQANFLPVVIFLCSAFVSFATGTSWGTMGILCPVTVAVAAELVAGLPAEEATSLFYASVGSVLAGAVFGDHCSPISDTTVLSALASECSLESHVWTQIPYALTAAIVAVLCGDLLCSHYHQPWWVGLLAGTVVLLIIVFAIGRKVAYGAQPASPPPSGS